MERFGEPGIQPTTLVYISKEHEHSAAKFSSEILQKVHLLIWKPPQLHYSEVNVAAGFWHALQLFNQQGIQEVQLESHLSIAITNLP